MKKIVVLQRIMVILSILTVCHFLSTPSCMAQQITISIDPPIVQTYIKPGKSILVAYTVENKGDPTPFQFLVRPFMPQDQEGALTVGNVLEGPILFSLENKDITWEKPFFFQANEKKQAVVKIHIPEGTPEGDYYYILLAETVPSFAVGGQSTGIVSASVGSPLLINVTKTGVTEAKGSIAAFFIEPTHTLTLFGKTVRIVDTGTPIPLILRVQNSGNSFIDPQGTISVRTGNRTITHEILPQHILKNSQRILKINPPQEQLSSKKTMLLSGLGIGKNTISASVTFGENTPILFAQTDCIGIPIRFLFLLILTLCLAGTILFFFSKNRPLKEE